LQPYFSFNCNIWDKIYGVRLRLFTLRAGQAAVDGYSKLWVKKSDFFYQRDLEVKRKGLFTKKPFMSENLTPKIRYFYPQNHNLSYCSNVCILVN
jgi:hypothetical protein